MATPSDTGCVVAMDKPDFHHDMCKKGLILLLAATTSLAMLVTCDDELEPPSTNDEESAPNLEGSDDTVADATARNGQDHEEPGDYIWSDADVIQIFLNGNSISTDATGVITEGSKVTITSAGNYSISAG